ncbi:luciferase domain-containing protein [Halegenticoccus soli]|uniref:luciferase domain-containing protein n=1 Tax=Halegenticoccus soli TaxID=1985678 RepID=UPI000C6D8294|nr:luciferase family protein [Halegenticoccus soli]
MTTTTKEDREQYVDRIVDQVSAWTGIDAEPHRFGGTEFLLGPREVGHVHCVGIVDINFPRRMRDALIAAGKTGEHHVVPESGWTTFHVASEADVERARWLLRLSYLYRALTTKRTPEGKHALAALDVDAEIEELGLSDELRGMVERVRD